MAREKVPLSRAHAAAETATSRENRRHNRPASPARDIREREWAQPPECHDEVARMLINPRHTLDHLTARQRDLVLHAARAAVEDPPGVLRFGLLEEAIERVASDDDTP